MAEQKFYTVSADWDVLMTECAKVHNLWEKLIKPDVPPGFDMTLSKNRYNLITLSTPLPEFYYLWDQVFKNIRSYYDSSTDPLWIHAWMNVHRNEDLGKESLGWHTHDYCNYHGFIHLSDKETDTIFKNNLIVKNKRGMQYLGPGNIEHKVSPCGFSGIRVSIGYDILDDPRDVHFDQEIFVPIFPSI